LPFCSVRLLRDEKQSISRVSSNLGVSHTSLLKWLKDDSSTKTPVSTPPTPSLEDENRRLRQEVRILLMERDILKKAATFFAKECR
jgi:transposase